MVGMYTFIEGVLVWRLLGDFDDGPKFRMLMIRRNGERTNERQFDITILLGKHS